MDIDAPGRLLLECLARRPGEGPAAALDGLPPAAWQALVRSAVRHDVAPLLHHRLAAAAPRAPVPPRLVRALREAYLRTAARNMLLRQALSKVLAALRRDAIPVIVLKGAHLMEVVYDTIALRPMSDIDVLVRRSDVRQAEADLAALGYILATPSPARRRHYEESHFHLPYWGPGGVVIEVHWDLAEPAGPVRVDLDGLWERASPVTLADVETLALSPEDLILHLCFHAAYQHRFEMGLRPLCDIAETVRRFEEDLDWRRLERTATAWGVARWAYCGLHLAGVMLGARIPESTLDRLKPDDLGPQSVAVIRDYLLGPVPAVHVPVALQWAMRREGIRGRAAALLRGILPTPEELRRIYDLPPGSPRVYPYYLLRPFDLVRRAGADVLRLALRTKAGRRSLARERATVAVERLLAPRTDT